MHEQYIVPDKKIGQPNKKSKDQQMGERLWYLSIGIQADRLSVSLECALLWKE